MIWELAIWIPEESFVIDLMEILSNKENSKTPKQALLEMRDLLQKKPFQRQRKKSLRASDIIHFKK